MDFFTVGRLSEFGASSIRSYKVLGRIIAVVRRADNSFFALEGGCKHQGADLSQGRLEGMIITCPRHGWQYDLTTGQCISHDSAPLRMLPLRISGDSIQIRFEFIVQDFSHDRI